MMWSVPVTKAMSLAEKKRNFLYDQMDLTASKQPSSKYNTEMIASTSTNCSLVGGSAGGMPADSVLIQSAAFDPDRCVACTVESGHTLVHGIGGRGYGLGGTVMTSGCYQWKVNVLFTTPLIFSLKHTQ